MMHPDKTPFIGSYSFRLLSSYIKQYHKTLLALGCGDGTKLEYWRAKGLIVEGVDIDPEKEKICAAKQIPFTLVDLDDVESPLPFANDSFDVVTLLHVLEHIQNPARAVYEAMRIAKDLVLINSPLGHSYYSDDHIQFWYSFGEIISSLFGMNFVFFLEMVIAKPADVAEGTTKNVWDSKYNHVGFIAAIYKQLVADGQFGWNPEHLDEESAHKFVSNLVRHQAAMGRVGMDPTEGRPVVVLWGKNERIIPIKGKYYERVLTEDEKRVE